MENEDDLIRRYLLRELADEEERQRVEKRLMTDDAFFERLKMAEDELVDEYLGGELPQWEREKFELSFLTTPEGRQQVSFNKAFNKYVSEATKPSPVQVPTPAPPASKRITVYEIRGAARDETTSTTSDAAQTLPGPSPCASMLAFFSRQGGFATGALAVACLLLVISAVLGIRVLQLRRQLDQIRAAGQQGTAELQQQLAEEQARTEQLNQELQRQKADNANLEQQIAKLTGGQENPEKPQKEQPQRTLFALVLNPGMLRSGGQNAELKLQPGADSYKVKLLLDQYQDLYPSYTAALRTIGGDETPLPGILKPSGPRSARSITVNLPASMLPKGDYRLKLYGPAPEREPAETYQFRVVE